VMPLRILLADDHAIVRQGLKLLIDNQPDMGVVGEAIDGNDVLSQATALNPDIIVMDISMPGMNGLTATRTLKRQQPGVTIVALTRHDDDTYLEELLRAGASAYVLKQSAPTEFLRAIRAAAAGGVYLDPAMTSRVADGLLAGDAAPAHPPRSGQAHSAQSHRSGQPRSTRSARSGQDEQPRGNLTDRESEVLRLIAVGHSNKEAASQLGISVKTVEVHKANAMRKLGLAGRVDIVRYAVMQGWLYDT
jgi:DNA-binding NarL/FixJ family response regulator